MKRYARKRTGARKKNPRSAGQVPLKARSQRAQEAWLKRYQAEASQIRKKKRPSKKDLEQLKVLRVKIREQQAKLKPKLSRKRPLRSRQKPLPKQPPKARVRKIKGATSTALPRNWQNIKGAELNRLILKLAKKSAKQQKAERLVLLKEYTRDERKMRDRLLELRQVALSRGEIARPTEPFRRPFNTASRSNFAQKVHVPGDVFLTDPGTIPQVMFDATAQANKLTPRRGATWLATIAMIVYGQKTHGSPPSPWLGRTEDASLFQVQAFESTGAQPTRIGVLDKLEDELELASEIENTVVWLEYITIQQFVPLDTEEKKEWRRQQEQARKRRQKATKRKQAPKAKPKVRKVGQKPSQPLKKKTITRKPKLKLKPKQKTVKATKSTKTKRVKRRRSSS